MTATPIILHHDICLSAEGAALALKGLSCHVEMLMIAPKPHVEALTGLCTPKGMGADVFVDNWMIARALMMPRPMRLPSMRGVRSNIRPASDCSRPRIPRCAH